MSFETRSLPGRHDVVAPDGSEVRILLRRPSGSMAHFRLPAGEVATAILHRTIDEIWYVTAGRGEMWRRNAEGEEVVALAPGTCLTIPVGTRFQFRATGDAPLDAIGVAMPPWPGEGEAVVVEGPWTPTVPR